MPFPGNWIYPQKIREISRPEHSGTSSSLSRLSTGMWDLLLPGLFQVRKHSGIPKRFPKAVSSRSKRARECRPLSYMITIILNSLSGPDDLTSFPIKFPTAKDFRKQGRPVLERINFLCLACHFSSPSRQIYTNITCIIFHIFFILSTVYETSLRSHSK